MSANVRRHSVFEYRCLNGIDKIKQENFVSRSKVKAEVPCPRVQSPKEEMNGNRLRQMKHILYIPEKIVTLVGRGQSIARSEV